MSTPVQRAHGPDPDLQFALKIASRCNLDCGYCYVYNKGDDSWRARPPIMSDEVLRAALGRIRAHCARSGQGAVRVTFHGGEPCLVGARRFGAWCEAARAALGPVAEVHLSLQTNGTLLDEAWAEVLRAHEVSVGISVDGPREVHDALRVDHVGRGSYAAAARGLALLRDRGIPFEVLCVVRLGGDGLRVHRHLVGLGARQINYLFPDHTRDTIDRVREVFGPAPCADFLLPVLEDWWARGPADVRIGLFWNLARAILGGDPDVDQLGNLPYRYVFVETGGEIEVMDVLRACGPGLCTTGLDVMHDDFSAIYARSALPRTIVLDGPALPAACAACPEASTCGGGYLPHRYSAARGFDNPTVWCEDMRRLLGRMRQLLDVDPGETRRRRGVREELHHGV